jgi:hypothetical protein
MFDDVTRRVQRAPSAHEVEHDLDPADDAERYDELPPIHWRAPELVEPWPEHDDDLHDRWHNRLRGDRISMGELMDRCPACAAEAAEDAAAEQAALDADELEGLDQ